MPLPVHLNTLLEEMLASVRADPDHHLRPRQRLPLYQAFDYMGNSIGHSFYVHLQILTVKHFQDVWDYALWDYAVSEGEVPPVIDTPQLLYTSKYWDDDVLKENLPQYILDLAEAVLDNTIEREMAEALSQDIWVALDVVEADDTYPFSALHVACAAHEALRAALGYDLNWDELIIEFEDTDVDTFMWGNDAAKWASWELGGLDDDDTVNLEKRLEFWEWWLTEAIPKAWELANKAN